MYCNRLNRCYICKIYDINRIIDVVGKLIKQKWNGFSEHYAAVV